MKLRKFLPFFIFLSIFSGCASIPVPKVEKISIERFEAYQLPDGERIFPESADKAIPDVDILKLNDEIKSLLDDSVVKIRGPEKRLNKLAEIIVQKISYDMVNDRFGVKTAQETFDSRTGNCLSFSNLFIAMARYAGLRSNYQEIPTLPNWSREGELLFFARHIGAAVDIREYQSQMFQIEYVEDTAGFRISQALRRYFFTPASLALGTPGVNPYSYRSISDNRAFAQFYNNKGSQRLAEGNNADAFRYFIKAIKTDPELSYAWSNLGVVYRKNGQFDAAEAAYFQGLAVTYGSKDISVLTIMNNLSSLYELKGDTEKASFYESQVAAIREKNPYYKYTTAKTAFLNKYYEMSIKRFKEAIRLKDDEHLFYYGLALAYVKTGDIANAKKNINKAIKYSWNDEKKSYYKNVLTRLGSNTIN